MSQRLSLDCRSFKRLLSALFQQIQRQGLRGSAGDRIDPQCLADLIQVRQELKSGRPDLNAVINRLVKLTQRVIGAAGAGVWLFANNEIFYCAGAGNASNDERLRLEVISKLATSCQLSKDTPPRLGSPTAKSTFYDASYDLGCAKSLLVEPIYQGHDIAGALAAFSDELNAFTERDVANIHLLADVLAQALSKAAEGGLQKSVALEPAAMLMLIERIIPALQKVLESNKNAGRSTHGFPRSEPDHDLPAVGTEAIPLLESHESGEKPRATEAIGGTWTELEQAPTAPSGDSATSLALEDTNVPRIGVLAALQSKLAEPSTLWPVVRQKWERSVACVRNHATRTLRVLRLAGWWLLNRIKQAGHQIWRTARRSSDSPPLPRQAAYGGLCWMKVSVSNAVRSARNRLWVATEYRANPPTVALPIVVAQRGLRHAQDSFLYALKSANTQLQTLLQSRPSLRAFRRAAPVLTTMVITITFLILKTDLHNPPQTTASRSRTAGRENTTPLNAGSPEYREPARSDGVAMAGTPEAHVAEQFGTPAPLQVSHMQITDDTTREAIRTLSRYELPDYVAGRYMEMIPRHSKWEWFTKSDVQSHKAAQPLPSGSPKRLVKATPRLNTISASAISMATECR